MPILERAEITASDDPTRAAIEAIRLALSTAIAEDLPTGEPLDESPPAADAGGEADDDAIAATPGVGSLSHGKIRLHAR
jgi:hypothetical protein